MGRVEKSANLDRQGAGLLKQLFNGFIGEAHRTGFDSPYLRSCLYVYAGGGKMPGEHVERHLINMGIVFENSKLTPNGEKLFRYMSHNTTSTPYMWALNMADPEKVETALYPKTKEKEPAPLRELVL